MLWADHDRLKRIGIDGPGSAAASLRRICQQSISDEQRREELESVRAYLGNAPPSAEVEQLRALLDGLWSDQPAHGHGSGNDAVAVQPPPLDTAGNGSMNETAAGGTADTLAAATDTPVIMSATSPGAPESAENSVPETNPPANATSLGSTVREAAAGEVQTQRISLGSVDRSIMVRSAPDAETIDDYADAMAAGAVFPPIHVFLEGTRYRLADGQHRVLAAERVGRAEIEAVVHTGDAKAALWFALGANRTNGRRLSGTDKRTAIRQAIEGFPEKSQTQIAEQVGCAQSYVSKVRRDIAISHSATLADRVVGKDGKSYPAERPCNGPGRVFVAGTEPSTEALPQSQDCDVPSGDRQPEGSATDQEPAGVLDGNALDGGIDLGVGEIVSGSASGDVTTLLPAPAAASPAPEASASAERVILVVLDTVSKLPDSATRTVCHQAIADAFARNFPGPYQAAQDTIRQRQGPAVPARFDLD